jgi:Zn-dependent M28 family amino/carboxypeptidase
MGMIKLNNMLAKISVSILLLLGLACKTSKPSAVSVEAAKANQAEVTQMMEALTSDDMAGRDSGTEGIEKAAVLLETTFKSYGVNPYFETYRDRLSNFDKATDNIVGVIPGTDPKLGEEIVLFGAHYDHIGKGKPNGADDIANGANDNASGTTVVMQLAKYFAKRGGNKRTLVFALFSAEEKGLLGSKHLAQKMKAQNAPLYAMFNFEMVGVPLVDKDYLVYATGYEKSNMAEVVNGVAEQKIVGFLPTAKEYNLFQRSDNYPFHEEFGVPSQTFSTFDFTNFEHYHGVGDEMELMDMAHMTELINTMAPVLEKVVNQAEQKIKYN